jgi:hypothetical protein
MADPAQGDPWADPVDWADWAAGAPALDTWLMGVKGAAKAAYPTTAGPATILQDTPPSCVTTVGSRPGGKARPECRSELPWPSTATGPLQVQSAAVPLPPSCTSRLQAVPPCTGCASSSAPLATILPPEHATTAAAVPPRTLPPRTTSDEPGKGGQKMREVWGWGLHRQRTGLKGNAFVSCLLRLCHNTLKPTGHACGLGGALFRFVAR